MIPGWLKNPADEKNRSPRAGPELQSPSDNGKLTKPWPGSAEVCRRVLPFSYE